VPFHNHHPLVKPINTSLETMPTRQKTASVKRRLFDDAHEEQHEEVPASSIVDLTTSPPATVSLLETPQKKRRVDSQLFFSPKGKAIVTPDKEEEIPTPVKQPKEEKKKDPYVPTYIHKNLSYQRKGQALLGENAQKTFELVEAYFEIPEDFEQSRSFGPLSGTCFEERAIRAYNLSLLDPKKITNATLEICSACATLGHKRNDCPDLI
jgi:hypothetical protein